MEMQLKRDGVLGLERCVGEFVTEMLRVVECGDTEEGEMKLLMSTFPNYRHLFQQLSAIDAEYAKQCSKQYIEYIKGPPNRPTVDKSGLMDVIVKFLMQSASCQPTN